MDRLRAAYRVSVIIGLAMMANLIVEKGKRMNADVRGYINKALLAYEG